MIILPIILLNVKNLREVILMQEDLIKDFQLLKEKIETISKGQNAVSHAIAAIHRKGILEKKENTYNIANLIANIAEIVFDDIKVLLENLDKFNNDQTLKSSLIMGMIELVKKEVPSAPGAFDDELYLQRFLYKETKEYEDSLHRLNVKAKKFVDWKEIYLKTQKNSPQNRLAFTKMQELAYTFEELNFLFEESKDKEFLDRAAEKAKSLSNWIKFYINGPGEEYRIKAIEKIKEISDSFENWKFNLENSGKILNTALKTIIYKKMISSAETFEDKFYVYDSAIGEEKLLALDEIAKMKI